MTEIQRESIVAEGLADFRDRRSRGEFPQAEDYADSLGDAYVDFLEILGVEEVLTEVLEPPLEPALPRNFGPYTLLRELGRGAVGIVYEAVHRELGRRQAVKVLRAGFDEEGSALERFRREAKALASVHHDHIVAIHDAGEVGGRAYYAMALVEGPTLGRLARDARPDGLNRRELCRGLAGVADALHALHESGVVHRDVKPSNIMVDQDGRMVLADFGLARSVASASLTRTGQALGTPLYMSPEQMMGKREEVDARSDVYGLGATLYEVLAGEPVFRATDVRVLLTKVLTERPRSLRRIAPDIPPDLDAIVGKSLEKRSDDRYASAAAMREDLLAFGDGRRVSGRPVSPLRRASRRARPFALPIAAAVLLAVGLFLWMGQRPARLHVESFPRASVLVDGKELGSTPKSLDVEAGSHWILLQRDHFKPYETQIALEAGDELPFNENLIPLHADDPIAMGIIQDELLELDRERAFAPRPPARRSARTKGVVQTVLLPQGDVQREDLDRFILYIPEDAPDEGWLVFRRASGEVLHREPFAPERIDTLGPIPETVRSALEPGDLVTWGYVQEDGTGYTADFRLQPLGSPLEEELARLDEKSAHLDPASRAFLKGLLLLENDRPMSAFVGARKVARDPTEKGASVLPWGILREALRDLGLAKSKVTIEIEATIAYFPEPIRRAWFDR